MNLRDVGLSLIGGSILYVSMAACAGSSSSNSTAHTTSGGGAGGISVHDGNVGGSTASHGGTSTTPGSGGIGGSLTNPVPPANAEPSAGTRLKPKFRQGEDGAKEYLSGVWYDSQRQEDCTFTLAGDGKSRCLPDGAEFRYYADASCATPMVVQQGACAAPKYGISNSDAACGLDPSSVHVYTVGAATSPPMIYGKSGASCFAIGPTTTDYTYYTVGAEVPASSFVAATVGHD